MVKYTLRLTTVNAQNLDDLRKSKLEEEAIENMQLEQTIYTFPKPSENINTTKQSPQKTRIRTLRRSSTVPALKIMDLSLPLLSSVPENAESDNDTCYGKIESGRASAQMGPLEESLVKDYGIWLKADKTKKDLLTLSQNMPQDTLSTVNINLNEMYIDRKARKKKELCQNTKHIDVVVSQSLPEVEPGSQDENFGNQGEHSVSKKQHFENAASNMVSADNMIDTRITTNVESDSSTESEQEIQYCDQRANGMNKTFAESVSEMRTKTNNTQHKDSKSSNNQLIDDNKETTSKKNKSFAEVVSAMRLKTQLQSNEAEYMCENQCNYDSETLSKSKENMSFTKEDVEKRTTLNKKKKSFTEVVATMRAKAHTQQTEYAKEPIMFTQRAFVRNKLLPKLLHEKNDDLAADFRQRHCVGKLSKQGDVAHSDSAVELVKIKENFMHHSRNQDTCLHYSRRKLQKRVTFDSYDKTFNSVKNISKRESSKIVPDISDIVQSSKIVRDVESKKEQLRQELHVGKYTDVADTLAPSGLKRISCDITSVTRDNVSQSHDIASTSGDIVSESHGIASASGVSTVDTTQQITNAV